MKLVRSRTPRLVERQTSEEEEQEQEQKQAQPAHEAPAKIAFIAELEREKLAEGPDAGVWFQAIGGGFRAHDGEIAVRPELLIALAAHADFAFLLHPDAEVLRAGAVTMAETCQTRRIPRPFLFCGPFSTGSTREIGRLAGLVDGVVVRPQEREEAVLEAEELRRAASGLGEALLTAGGGWKSMPAVCLSAAPDVLALVSPSVVEFCLLATPPGERAVPGGSLVVCELPEWRPWWATACGAVGPATLAWRPWLRDPRRLVGA